ncbi:MAG: hypothetical protein QGI32_03350 [Candidatus Latescibacteria bacterium]|nr:hypothetical protein [Candidatus Latescibacterota bacterium]
MKFVRKSPEAIFLALVCIHSVVPGRSSAAGDGVTAPHVFARVALLREKIEMIRFEMGRPRSVQSDLAVSNVVPREVYSQALALFLKADRLCFEQTRGHASAPEIPDEVIRPAHVLAVVDASLARLDLVGTSIGMVDRAVEPTRDDSRTPTDVFRSIIQANRQLNLMLDNQVSHSDVFQQVTLAISYTSRLLARFPGGTRIPASDDYERGKRPADVHRRLVGCFEVIQRIAELVGLKTLELRSLDATEHGIIPSDVYYIASLLVSDLAYLHSHVLDADPPVEMYYPGRKFPSHVYQRAGLLKKQLAELLRHVEQAPERLLGEE